MYYQTPALIIKSFEYRDSDELVTFLTPERGKKRALARGVKKAKSSLRAPLQPFCHSLLYISQGRELDVITQARMIDFFPDLRDDIKLSMAGMYVMELLDKSLPDHEPAGRIFNLAIVVLGALATQGNAQLLLRYFEINLLAALGYRPELESCVICHKTDALAAFSSSGGGVVCSRCLAGFALAAKTVHGETLAVLKRLLGHPVTVCNRLKVSTPALQEMDALLEDYWLYHLQSPSQVKRILRDLP